MENNQNYILKKIQLEDLTLALSLVWNVFLEFEAPEYSSEGVEEFKKFIDFKIMKERFLASQIFLIGSYDKDKLVGIIGYNLKPHINLLFVDKNYHRQGIAKTLFYKMIDDLKSVKNISEITANSSPYAHDIYKKMGFIDTNTEQNVNGIRFCPMKYVC